MAKFCVSVPACVHARLHGSFHGSFWHLSILIQIFSHKSELKQSRDSSVNTSWKECLTTSLRFPGTFILCLIFFTACYIFDSGALLLSALPVLLASRRLAQPLASWFAHLAGLKPFREKPGINLTPKHDKNKQRTATGPPFN